jgi:hypothetical protein
MKFEKLNNRWNAEPNAPNLMINKGEDYVELTFDLNPFIFNNIEEGDKGILEFQNVYEFFSGSINDEGYFNGKHRYTNDQLPWGEFYELLESNWQTEFPKDSTTINSNIDKSELRHFILFLKDQEIECLSSDYFFQIKFKDEEVYRGKYPNQSFNHYLAMFGINQLNTTDINFADQNNMYLAIEGEGEFKDLKDEVTQIINNKDFMWFLKQAITNEIPNINMERIKAMMQSIVNHKI